VVSIDISHQNDPRVLESKMVINTFNEESLNKRNRREKKNT